MNNIDDWDYRTTLTARIRRKQYIFNCQVLELLRITKEQVSLQNSFIFFSRLLFSVRCIYVTKYCSRCRRDLRKWNWKRKARTDILRTKKTYFLHWMLESNARSPCIVSLLIKMDSICPSKNNWKWMMNDFSRMILF